MIESKLYTFSVLDNTGGKALNFSKMFFFYSLEEAKKGAQEILNGLSKIRESIVVSRVYTEGEFVSKPGYSIQYQEINPSQVAPHLLAEVNSTKAENKRLREQLDNVRHWVSSHEDEHMMEMFKIWIGDEEE